MTLREKTLLVTCAILVGMIALLFLISNLTLGANVAEQERQSVNQTVARAAGILIQPQNDRLVTGYTVLRDIYGKPVLALSVEMPRSAHELAQESLLYLLSALSAVGLILLFANRAILRRLVLSPLDKLSAEIRQVGLSGELTARVTTTGKDELSRLAGHINRMLAALAGSQQRRLESEERYRAVVQGTADGIFLLDLETRRILEANAAFQNLVGYTAEELAGLTLYDLVAHDRASIDDNAQKLLAEKRRSFGERKYRHKCGSLVEVEVSANLIMDSGKEVACVIVRDVTRRKWAEDALHRNEAQFRALIDNSLDVIGILNADGTVCYLSPAVERMLGFKPDRLMGRNAFDMIHPDDAANVRETLARGIPDPNFSGSVEFRLQHQDASWVNVEVTARSLLENPAVMGIVFSMRDITARKRMEEALRDSKERYHAVLEQAAEIIFLFDPHTNRLLDANSAFCKSLGYGREEVQGLKLDDFVAQDGDRQDSQIRLALRQTGRFLGERQYRRKNGSLLNVEVGDSVIAYGGQEVVCAVARDLTPRKWAERELEEARTALVRRNRELTQILDAGNSLRLSLDLNTVLREIVGAAHDSLGFGTIVLNLLDRESNQLQVRAHAGLDEEGVRVLGQAVFDWNEVAQLMQEQFRVGRCYFIPQGEVNWDRDFNGPTYNIVKEEAGPGDDAWRPDDVLIAPIELRGGETVGILSLDQPLDGKRPDPDTLQALEIYANQAAVAIENARLYEQIRLELAERKRAEEALQESEERYRRLVELSPDAIAIHAGGRIVFANPAAASLIGTATPEDLIGKPLLDFVHPDYRDLVNERVRQQRVEGKTLPPVEEQFIRLDGTVVDVEVSASPFTYEGKPGVQVIVHDISARRRREAELQQRADEFAALFETSRDLATQGDLSNLLQSSVERAMMLLNAPCGFIYLYDAAQRALELTVEIGMAVSPGLRMSLGEGMAGQVAQTLQPLIVDDYHIWEHRSPQYAGVPYAAIVEVPMLYGGELIGVLGVAEVGSAERKFSEADARLLSLFAVQAAGAVHNADLLQQTRARAEQLALLYDAGLALNSVLEPRAQLEFLFKIATRTLRADRAEFFRYDSTRSELRLELGVGYPEGAETGLRELVFALGAECGIVGQVAQARIPQYLPDVTIDLRWVEVDPEIQSVLLVPVEHENQLLGVLSILSRHPRAFTPQDERLLVLFANQAAVALENARLFEETRRRADQLAILNRIASALSQTLDLDELLEVIYREINAALHAEAFFIALYDDASGELNYRIRVDEGVREPPERRRLAPGLTAHVIFNKKPLLIHDWEQEKEHYPPIRLWGTMKAPLSWLNVPMLFRDTVVGVISLQSYRANAFGEEEERLLATIADQAAVAVEKARLFTETEHRLQRLHALDDIDKAISSSLDLRVTLEVVLDQVSTQLHVDAADILLHNPRTQMLSYGSSRGFRSRALRYTELRLGEGLAGTAALERRIVHYPDLTMEADGLRRSPLLAQESFIAYFAVPLIAKGEVKGVLEIFHRSSLEPDQEWLDFAQALGAQAAIAIDDAQLFQDLQRTNVELTLAYDATIEGWARALELRDQEAAGHSGRVTELTVRLARMMGLREEELVQVRRGTVLHDIGKMAIPDGILFKPDKLTAAEWEIMQRHPTYAYEMLSPIAYLRQALDIPYCHHEKWDGTGYPRGLKGEQIPLAARIFAVADVWDALRSDRRYRAEQSEEQARAYILEQAGKHFDPKVVEKFLQIETETL